MTALIAGEIDPASISSRAELQWAFTALARRIESLETELESERDRRRELEARLQKQDDRYGLILDDILALEDAVEELRRPSVDQEPPEDALPIMRLTWAYRASPETLKAKERRAAVVWSHFFDVCSKTPTKYVLDSSRGSTILTGDEGASPYRQTIRRVMKLISELGQEYVELRSVDDRNALVIDRASFDEYIAELLGRSRTWVSQKINAYEWTEQYLEEYGSENISDYSYFEEAYKKKGALADAGLDLDDPEDMAVFQEIVYHDELPMAIDVRKLPKLLSNEETRELLLDKGRGRKALDKLPEVEPSEFSPRFSALTKANKQLKKMDWKDLKMVREEPAFQDLLKEVSNEIQDILERETDELNE